MAEVITMPKLSDTMEEGTIVEWHKQVGDQIEQGDVLAEVETDKATMELESFHDGTILYIDIDAGKAVKVNDPIAVVGDEGEDYQQVFKQAQSGESEEKEETPQKAPEAEPEKQKQTTKQGTDQDSSAKSDQSKVANVPEESKTQDGEQQRIKASPLAKKLAREKGIDLTKVEGSGDGGRIVKRDIEAAEVQEPEPVATMPTVGDEDYEDQPVGQMRKTIAKRLSESKFTAPHFYLTMEINMDEAIRARKRINETLEDKISFNDLILKASAVALKKHPQVNASWLGDKIRFYKHINIGVAVAVDEGLVVPVLRFADQKGIETISREVKEYAQKAQDKKLQPEDYQGNTFSVSNLGMFGIEEFTAIINPPDSAILAIGGIKQIPVIDNGELKEQNVMKVTMSCDHRVVDGVTGSRFLQTFKAFMEDPVRMII